MQTAPSLPLARIGLPTEGRRAAAGRRPSVGSPMRASGSDGAVCIAFLLIGLTSVPEGS